MAHPPRQPRPPALRTSLARIYLISRPYSTPYASLCCLCGLLCGAQPARPADYLLALSLVPSISMGGSALNDLLHWQADQIAGRNRPHSRGLLLGLGLTFIGLTLALAWLVGPRTLWLTLLSLLISVLYGLAKSVPGVGNLLRGAIASALVLAAGSASGATAQTGLLALGIGLIDAAGNIWGDLRDLEADRKAGTRTIAVRTVGGSLALFVGLLAAGTCLLAPLAPAVLPCSLFGAAICMIAERREGHLWFLVNKYVMVSIIALNLARDSVQLTLIAVLLLLAIPSIRLYQRLHQLPERS